VETSDYDLFVYVMKKEYRKQRTKVRKQVRKIERREKIITVEGGIMLV
jgi:preprotein translocase subunit YajC